MKNFACDNESIGAYMQALYGGDDALFEGIRIRAAEAGLPDIHISPFDSLHLRVIARACRPRRAIEIGTLAGLLGTCIAQALPADGKLYTFEYEPRHAAVAQKTFELAGVANKVKILVGAAIENLKTIESDGPFDLVFIDADKASYPRYLEWATKHLRVGGILLADNTFAWGNIADASTQDANVKALQKFNQQLAQNKSFWSTILPTGEGLSMAVKV